MVKFSTKLGRAKRNKKSFAVRKSHEKQLRCKIAREIINAILEKVENEKQSTQDCKKILHEILEKVLASSKSPRKTGESSNDPHEYTSPALSDDEYNFFNDPRIQEEIERIEQHELEIEKVESCSILTGCRIVDISYFLNSVLRLQVNHNKKCTGGSLEVNKEHLVGLRSTFVMKCNACDKEISIYNEDPIKKESVLNRAVVWGTLSVGNTFTHLGEFLSVLDIPGISSTLFYTIQRHLSEVWKNSLWNIIQDAAEEEYDIAVRKNNVDKDGNGCITVCLDGGWSKRSYGHSYSANSGVAVIIGKETGKLLFLGVRNKYCSICARAANLEKTPKEHLCFKNWTGSSASMEQDIIVEGFNNSIPMFKLKYTKFIADGDSSVYNQIKERVSYGMQVQKIECINHALKNYGKRLHKIKNDVEGVSLEARKMLTTSVIKKLEDSIKIAASRNTDIDALKTDMRNTVNHVFGNHFSCKPNLCVHASDISDDNTPKLISSGAHHHIYSALTPLLNKAAMLIDRETNNRAELFMSILARFNMGKRLNLIQRDSFQMRSVLTGLKYNEGHQWHEKPWKIAFQQSPPPTLRKFLLCQEKRVERSRKYREQRIARKLKFAKKKKNSNNKNEPHYGPNIAEIHMSETEIENEVQILCQRLKVTSTERKEILEKTVGQFENPTYRTERMHRLTASFFGAVIKRKRTTSCDALVKRILSPKSFSTEATDYGHQNERVAISKFCEKTGKKVMSSGIFVDFNFGFLAASPDGIINEEEIVEVKCLQKIATSELSLLDAVRKKMVPCLKIENEEITLKTNHDYYYQVQGQLNITGASKAYFVIYSGDRNDIFVQIIMKDKTIWEEIMLPKLKEFYLNCVAPEIILNRRGNNLKCKDPDYIIKAQIESQERKRPRKT